MAHLGATVLVDFAVDVDHISVVVVVVIDDVVVNVDVVVVVAAIIHL